MVLKSAEEAGLLSNVGSMERIITTIPDQIGRVVEAA
jgi:hypothetical protein